MTQSTHIIKTQEYHIDLEDHRDSYKFQSAISELQKTRINVLLNDVLNKFDNKNAIYQFNTIKLDLGTIKISNYENELVYRLEEELTKYLSYTILENGRLQEGKTIQINNRMLDELEYFLINGHLLWNSSHSKSPIQLFDDLFRNHPEPLGKLLKTIGKKDKIRKRMISQFNDDSLEKIVALVAKNESKYIISYKKNILDCQKKNKLVKTPYHSFKTAVWEIVLSYLFAADRSYHDRKSFLNDLIKKIAEKYAITFDSLLQILSQLVRKDQNVALENKGFKKIIFELTRKQQLNEDLEVNTIYEVKTSDSETIEKIDQFLDSSSYYNTFPFRSKQEFNNHFFKILRSRDPILLFYLNKWLSDYSQKKRLLTIASTQCLNQIIELSNMPSIITTRTFVNTLGAKNGVLSAIVKDHLQKILNSKAELILSLPSSKNYSERDLIQQLLKNILKFSALNEDLFIKLLQETKPQLSNKNQEIVDQFLIGFYQNFGNVILESIATEIQSFTNKIKVDFWESWLEDKMLSWMITTRLSHKALLKYVEKILQAKYASERLLFFIREKKDFNLHHPKKDRSLERVLFNGKTLDAHRLTSNPKKRIAFILENGELPWWLESTYSWDHFNTEFYEQWTVNKGEFIELVKKNIKSVSYASMLEDDRLLLIWEHLAITKDNFILLKKVHGFMKMHLRAVGTINTQTYLNFKDAILLLLVKTPTSELTEKLIQFFKKWSLSTRLNSHASISEVFIVELIKISQKVKNKVLQKDLSVWIDALSEAHVTAKSVQSSPATIKDFLSALSANPIHLKPDTNILEELTQLQLFRPDQFQTLLQKIAFRGSLLKELSEKELISLIEQKINTNQKEFYSQALQQVQSFKHYVSVRQFQSLNALFFELLLLKLSSDGVRSWGLKDWGYLVYHCLFHELGKSKSKHVLFRMQEKLSFENDKARESGQKLLFHLNALSKEYSDKTVKATKKMFDVLMGTSTLKTIYSEGDLLKYRNAFILQKINSNQLEFYRQAILHLERFNIYITAQKYDLIMKLFTKILVLKLSDGGMRSWELKDWSDLLFYSINAVIGKEKNSNLFIKIKEKIENVNTASSSKTLFIRRLSQFANKIPMKTIIDKETIAEESSYRKLGEKSPREFQDPIFINNAGLIILAPYLGVLFEKCGLMATSVFKDDKCKYKAVQLLAYAATGTSQLEEHDLIIHKVLCGLEITEVLDRAIALEATDKETVDSLLKAVTLQWTALKETSIEGLRTSFLQREGRLEEEGDQFFLRVEQKSFDMLLDQIPWNISKIKLSWMQKILEVIWRT